MVKETEQVAFLPATVRHGGSTIDRQVYSGIQEASEKTGVNFSFMLAKARHESGFQTDARNRSSSAQGLYQFTDQTWMDQVKRNGAKYGLGDLAARLSRRPGGGYQADSAQTRQAILALRKDPRICAAMAAEYANENRRYLTRKLGRPATETDLYMAHFLGPGGAADFLSTMDRTPNVSAADAFPKAARANPRIFYSPNGNPRSLIQVYAAMDTSITTAMNRFSGKPNAPDPQTGSQVAPQLAQASPPTDGDQAQAPSLSAPVVPNPPQMTASIRHQRDIRSVVETYAQAMGKEPPAAPGTLRPLGKKPVPGDISGTVQVALADNVPRPLFSKPPREDMSVYKNPEDMSVYRTPAPAPLETPAPAPLPVGSLVLAQAISPPAPAPAAVEAAPVETLPVEPAPVETLPVAQIPAPPSTGVTTYSAMAVAQTFDPKSRLTAVHADIPALRNTREASGPPPGETQASLTPPPSGGLLDWLRRAMIG